MSKEAAQRAMREARFNQRTKGTPAAAPARKAPPRAEARASDAVPPAAPVPTPPTDELCGHRSMNGRTCTREQGHAAKSHRYS